MASGTDASNRIRNGATLPTGGGKLDIRRQGQTKGAFGSETMETAMQDGPPDNETLIP